MTAASEGIGGLPISAGSSMPKAMYELFAMVEKRTAAWAHRGART